MTSCLTDPHFIMVTIAPQLTTSKTPMGWNRNSPIPTDPCYEGYKGGVQSKSTYKMKNPIPADSGNVSTRSSRPASPKPRVKPEALAIARNNQGRELAYLFNPAMKVIPIGARSTRKDPIDHGKENYKKIKEIQRANKEKQIESSRQTPVKAVYKPDKFDHVQSKVSQQMKTPLAPRPATTDGSGRIRRSNSMGNLSVTGKSVNPSSAKHTGQPVAVKPATANRRRPSSAREASQMCNEEKSTGQNKQPTNSKRPKSHIVLNKEAVRKRTIKRSPSMSALDDLKKKREKEFTDHKPGRIPKYLKDRQQQWKDAEDERVANLPDPTVPAGHVLMDDQDRKRTLAMLKSSHVELLSELKAIPLSRDTLRVRNRRDELEKKLREVDSAIKIFSRPRVFIKNE